MTDLKQDLINELEALREKIKKRHENGEITDKSYYEAFAVIEEVYSLVE